MKPQEIREMSSDERVSKLADLGKRFFELRAQSVTETLENTRAMRNVRRDIARIKTIIAQQSK